MKKHIKLIITICLALCMVLCLGLTTACDDGSGSSTFTIIVVDEGGNAVVGQQLQYCADGNNAACINDATDSNGKVTVDLKDKSNNIDWDKSATIHVLFFNLPSGCNVYYDDVGYANGTGPFIDHHKVKSATFTIKALPEDIEVGYEYSANLEKAKSYSTVVKGAGKAIIEADVHNGTFELSALVGNSTTPITATLTASNPSATLNLGDPDPYIGIPVIFTLTPKSANGNITFACYPVYNLGTALNIYGTDVYKVYFNLPNSSTELSFEVLNPEDDPDYAANGFPITLTIGSDAPVTWNNVGAISTTPVTTQQTGDVPFTFEFADENTANLYVNVSDAAASQDELVVLGKTIEVTLASAFGDGVELKFTPDVSGTYLVTFTGSTTATVLFNAPSKAQYGDALAPTDGKVKKNLEAGVEYDVVFGTSNESGDSYTAVFTKTDDVDVDDAGDSLDNGNPDDTNNPAINLDDPVTVELSFLGGNKTYTFLPTEAATYVITVSSTNVALYLNSTDNEDRVNPNDPDAESEYVFEIEVDAAAANTAINLIFSSVSMDSENVTITITKK